MVRQAVHVALGILVAWLSVPVVLNLQSPAQVMNTSFNSQRFVNTYGAIGRYVRGLSSPRPPCAHVRPKVPHRDPPQPSKGAAWV